MRRVLIIALSFFLIGFQAQATEKQTIQLSEGISIDFPVMPKLTERPDTKVYVYAEDGLCLMAQVMNVPAGKLNNVTLAEFSRNFTMEMLKEFNGQLTGEKEIDIAGFKGLEITYKSDGKNGLPENYTQRAVFLGGKVYTWFFVVSTELQESMKPEKEQFMNSFHIDPGVKLPGKTAKVDVGDFESGNQIGNLLGFGIVAALLVGLFFMLRWLIRLLKKNQIS